MQNANGNTNQTETSDVTTPVKAKRNYTKKAAANPSNQTPIAAAINPAITQTMQPIQVAVASVSATPQLNINSLRLKLGYGETLSVKKVLVTVPVKKPNKATFFRIRDGEEWEFPALILERKEDNETYLVTADVAELVNGLVRAAMLYLAVDRKGNPTLVPVPLPGIDGRRNIWHESLLQAVELGKAKWVRVVPNMPAGANDVLEAQSVLDEPQWPANTMDQLVEIAFRGKIITDISHPVIQGLLGLA